VIIATVLTVAALYVAQQVLIPLALAVLLAFLLAPLVSRLERWRLGRVGAVLTVVAVAFAVIGGLGWVVGRQVVRLAEDLPKYQDEIVHKVRRLRGEAGGMGASIARLGKELERAAVEPATRSSDAKSTTRASATQATARESTGAVSRETVGGAPAAGPPPPGSTPSNPLFAVALPAPASPVRTLSTYLGLVLGPLGTAGLVIVFVVFMLLEREDLRDRVIRLVSRGKYLVTTRALNDGADRISRYMFAQTIVNGTYGLSVAVGLWLIGLALGRGTPFPSFALWGVLCFALRFIPFVGPWIAAAFPVALSLAVYPGFSVAAATIALIVLMELITNNVLEPWLYGASTGLSTVAILVATVFWTWLWGPAGLLLSTPLTVCIVVLGKHVAPLKFFDVMLGDQPALPPPASYYQRLLAGDRKEAADVVREYADARGPDAVPDGVLLPALLLARRDRRDGDLSADDESLIFDATREILGEVGRAGRGESDEAAPAVRAPLVIGCPAHHRAEEVTLDMLAMLLAPLGCRTEVVSTRTLPAETEARIAAEQPALVFIAVLPPGGLVQARYLCRRLRRRFRDLKIVVGFWGRAKNFDRLLVRLRAAGASYVTTSLLQSRSQVQALLEPAPAPRAEPPVASVSVHVAPPGQPPVGGERLSPLAP
jgi:predicted PurR-regulated permease PerM/CheY-like chemotaxis protein